MTAAAILLTVLVVLTLLGAGVMFALSHRYEDLPLGGILMFLIALLQLTMLAAELGYVT